MIAQRLHSILGNLLTRHLPGRVACQVHGCASEACSSSPGPCLEQVVPLGTGGCALQNISTAAGLSSMEGDHPAAAAVVRQGTGPQLGEAGGLLAASSLACVLPFSYLPNVARAQGAQYTAACCWHSSLSLPLASCGHLKECDVAVSACLCPLHCGCRWCVRCGGVC